MLRKAGIAFALMLSIPTFASAWTVTAKIGSGAGAVTDGTTTLTKAATGAAVIGYYKSAAASQTLTVVPPVDGSYLVSSVVVDGVNVTSKTSNDYTINAGSPAKNHSLVVYYTQATSNVSITPAAGGYISVQCVDAANKPFGPISRTGFTGLKSTAKVKIVAAPNSDYKVTKINGADVTAAQGEVSSAIVTVGAGLTATAEFAVIPTVNAHISVGTDVTSLNGYAGTVPSATYAVNTALRLVTTATGNATPDTTFKAYSVDNAGVKTELAGVTPTATSVTFTAPGKYIVEVKATNGAAVAYAYTPVITIIDAIAARATQCTACHATREQNTHLVTNFLASGHAANSHGPTCTTCHTASTGTAHSGATNKFVGCIACHNGVYSRNFGGVQHFTNATTSTFRNVSAAYVGYKGKGNQVCSACHFNIEPHSIGAANETTFEQNADVLEAWAESGHGNRSGLAWLPSSSHDWRNSGSNAGFSVRTPSSDCIRCHTAQGYANFALSNYSTIKNVGAADGQRWNAPLSCNGCHVTDERGITTGTRIPAAAVKTFYNISTVDKVTALTVKARTAVNFPDVGESNICNGCHSARLGGTTLVTAVNNGLSLSNSSFQNSHYMAASGVMYMKAGFINFTSLSTTLGTSTVTKTATTYGQSLTADQLTTVDGVYGGVSSTHRKLGTPLINGDSHNASFFVQGNLDSNGPCVTCHMKGYIGSTASIRGGAGHTLEMDQATAQEVCIKCHDGEVNAVKGDNTATLAKLEEFLEEGSADFQAALALAKAELLANYKISYDPSAYPYFYDEALPLKNGKKQAVTDWTRSTANAPAGVLAAPRALKLEGACFNINLLSREPGAYVHGRTYTRRLIYDSIDFLDDGKVNQSVDTAMTSALGQTILDPLNRTTPAFVPGNDASTASDPYKYLRAYDRTTLKWNTPKRP